MSQEDFQRRLIAFWRMYEPTQLRIIDQWLSNWAGREQELFQELVRFHGPEPHVAHKMPVLSPVVESRDSKLMSTCRQLLQQVVLLYAPHRIGETETWFAAWEGRYEELLARLQRQIAIRDHLMKYFETHFPDRIEEGPALLRVWLGHERSLMATLEKGKTLDGIPPRPPTHRPTPVDDNEKTPLPFSSYRTQLQQFYRVYAPDKMQEVDNILESYKGRETLLFSKLHKKYEVMPAAAAGETSADGAAPSSPMKGKEVRPAVRHLIAANSVAQTAHFENFVQTFDGSDAELAWALRTYCRKGDQSPATTSSREEQIERQIQELERRVHSMPSTATSAPMMRDPAQLVVGTQAKDPDQQYSSLYAILARVGLQDLTPIFTKHEITLELFPTLTASDLADMGIHPDARRRSVLAALKKLY